MKQAKTVESILKEWSKEGHELAVNVNTGSVQNARYWAKLTLDSGYDFVLEPVHMDEYGNLILSNYE